jgi:hypothetical protein
MLSGRVKRSRAFMEGVLDAMLGVSTASWPKVSSSAAVDLMAAAEQNDLFRLEAIFGNITLDTCSTTAVSTIIHESRGQGEGRSLPSNKVLSHMQVESKQASKRWLVKTLSTEFDFIINSE